MNPRQADPEKHPIPSQPTYTDPTQYSNLKKWRITLLMAQLTFTSTLSSSIWSSTIVVTAAHFHSTETVMLLGVSLFVLGYALGPLLWGPMSELLGRKIPLFVGHFVFVLLQIPIATVESLPGVLVCRFLAGWFGAASVIIPSAAYADIWDPARRSVASAVFAIAAFSGPALGPVIGSFITESRLGWRWTAWIVLLLGAVVGVPAVVFVPETYVPVLKQRARGKWFVQVGDSDRVFRDFGRKYLSRPMLMLLHEPILVVMTLYVSITYGIMYLTFFAFPYTFSRRGWTRDIASLSFLGILVGVVTSAIGVTIYAIKYYQPRFIARGGKPCPEDRLPLIMLGGLILPAGLFWFAWTSDPSISWVPQIIAGFVIGAGIMLIFSIGIVYIIDMYLQTAASAVAANVFVRSIFAAGLPLAAPTMYNKLGVSWATSLLAFICVALIPTPFLLYVYGEKWRSKRKPKPTIVV